MAYRTRRGLSADPEKGVLALIIINVAAFFLSELRGSTLDSSTLIPIGALYSPAIAEGEYWRFLTSMFLHSGMRHLLNNMLTLGVLGNMVYREAGPLRFFATYFLGGIAGGAAEYALAAAQGRTVLAVGASGGVFAVMGGLLWIVIANRGRIAGMTLQHMLIYIGLSVYFGLASAGVANTAHIGGLIVGFLVMLVVYRKPGYASPFQGSGNA